MLRHSSSGPFSHTFAFPTWWAALFFGCVASLSTACGGKSDSDVFDDGGTDGTGGTASGGSGGTAPTGGSNDSGNGNGTNDTNSAGGSGGTQGTTGGNGSTAVTNGSSSNASSNVTASSTSSTTGGSGGGSSDDRCLLPIEPGPCEGAFEAYGYDAETGRCEKFIYGGCEGNDNRFDTITECLGLCEPAGLACESNIDCAIDHDCCGACGIEDPDQLVAVNAKYATFAAAHCFLLDCAYCPPSDEIGNFGARCNEGTCEVYDVRKSELSACEVDADCRLRMGLGCCESCGGGALVAVSTDYEREHKELCGGTDVGCPACAPIYPEDLGARCGSDGHCYVASLL